VSGWQCPAKLGVTAQVQGDAFEQSLLGAERPRGFQRRRLEVEGVDMPGGADGLGEAGGIPSFTGRTVQREVPGAQRLAGEALRAFGDAGRVHGSQGNRPKSGARFSFQALRPSSPSSER